MVELAHSLSLRNFPEAHTNTMPQPPGQHGPVSLCFKSTCPCVCPQTRAWVHGEQGLEALAAGRRLSWKSRLQRG